MIRAAIAVAALGGVASADDAKPSPPDPLAEHHASEANLESIAPREGVTFAVALGGGLVFGQGDVGRGPSASFRLGHVATPDTVITFELSGGSLLHELAGTLLHDDNYALMAGALHYVAPSLWVRGGAGFDAYTLEMGTAPTTKTVYAGVAGTVGAGIDLARKRYFVLGLEAFAIASDTHNGFTVQSSLCLGLSYY